MTEQDVSVRLENVGRSFGVTAAVRGISVGVRRGEVLSLVGHSGCGKSTLLRIIAGVETVDEGRVFLGGREVDGQAFVEPELRNVGFVFQDYALFPHLSVRDNILFGLRRLSRRDAAASAEDMIGRVGIGHLADRFPHTLSGGEQQRVALARALAPRPGIVLMDEPFSNLDQGLRERVRDQTLSLLKSLGTTVVIVTHDPEEALSTGDRVVLMHSGEIVQQGTAHDLYDRPVNAYAAEFFCPSGKVTGLVRDGRIETPLGWFASPDRLRSGDRATVHIRPHAIRVTLGEGDLDARVVNRAFRGGMDRVQLRIEGLDDPLYADVAERLPQGVETVRIAILPDRVLAFGQIGESTAGATSR
jgi:iron(III) transport system ATP-binding protein